MLLRAALLAIHTIKLFITLYTHRKLKLDLGNTL